jgi:nucleoside-triphosphatase
MKLFLQGRSGVGKSRLLRETLDHYAEEVAGFTVQRITQNGELVGFRAATIESGFPPGEAEYDPGMTGVFIFQKRQNVSALEEAILRAEEESRKPRRKLVLLDEIGGIELVSDVFMDTLNRILSGGKPCCGVFKSQENLAHTASILRLGEEYANRNKMLAARLKETGELLTVTEQNCAELREHLAARFQSLFREG